MNGRTAKKIRHDVKQVTQINVQKTYVGMIQALMNMPWKKRVKFAFCIVFKRQYK